jgi:[acyl-carrier-protein] S-malonyltransferase
VTSPAALVGGQPVSTAEVAAEVARLRAGPLADRLPPDATPAGRQLRRWTTQRLVLRRLLEQEAAARRLDLRDAAAPTHPDPALLGSAAADVLATAPAAQAVYTAVTAAVSVPETDIRAHYHRNPDRYRAGARWLVRQLVDATADTSTVDGLAGVRPVPVDPDTLPIPLRQALDLAAPGQVVGPVRSELGWHLAARQAARPAGTRPYAEVRGEIARALLDRRRQQLFARWLGGRVAELVQLYPGYEHPADLRNPDATHRH